MTKFVFRLVTVLVLPQSEHTRQFLSVRFRHWNWNSCRDIYRFWGQFG